MRINRAVAYLLAVFLTIHSCLSASATSLPTPPEAAVDTAAQTSKSQEPQPETGWYDESAYRGITWDMDLETVAAAEQGKARSDTVTVQKDLWLYELEMKKLVYRFEDGVMTSRIFTAKLNNAEAFSYLFFSLFRRYGIPILAEKRKAVWGGVQATITLQRSSEGLTIRYEVLR